MPMQFNGFSSTSRRWRRFHAICRAPAQLQPVVTLGEKLGVVMKFIRAAERGVAGEVSVCMQLYPGLRDFVTNPYLFTGNMTRHLHHIREHAIALARDHALEQLEEAEALANAGNADLASRRRKAASRLLFKLAPGSTVSIGAIQCSNGDLVFDPAVIARTLQAHWSEVFRARGIDRELLGRWIREDVEERYTLNQQQLTMLSVFVTRKDFETALKRSNNSCPGPDGIPYAAWRKLGPQAVDVLWEAFNLMVSDGHSMSEGYAGFNESLQFFLQKKAVDEVDGVSIFEPSGVRPLNVTNTDNRLVASAVRSAIEPVLALLITADQKGFIGGRSMASNILDVDEAMAHASLADADALAIFYDFATAFPAIEHAFLFTYFRWLDWPIWLCNIIRVLFCGNCCNIFSVVLYFQGMVLREVFVRGAVSHPSCLPRRLS